MSRTLIFIIAGVAIVGVLLFAVMRRVTPPPAWSSASVPYTNPSSVYTANTPHGYTSAVQQQVTNATTDAIKQFTAQAINVGSQRFGEWLRGATK